MPVVAVEDLPYVYRLFRVTMADKCLDEVTELCLPARFFHRSVGIAFDVGKYCSIKVKATWIYTAPSRETIRRSGMDHTVSPANHMPASLYLVSVHQIALPLTCDGVRLITAYYSSINPERVKD